MRRTLSAAAAGLALAITTATAPVAIAQTDTEGSNAVVEAQQNVDISEIDVNELLSYESTNGTVVTPNETITITPDHYDERLPLLNVYPLNDTFLQWDIDLDRATGVITITAPKAPEEQVGTNIAEYGEHEFRTRTNEGREVYFTLDFQPEKPAEEPEAPEEEPANPQDPAGEDGSVEKRPDAPGSFLGSSSSFGSSSWVDFFFELNPFSS